MTSDEFKIKPDHKPVLQLTVIVNDRYRDDPNRIFNRLCENVCPSCQIK